MNKIFHIQFAAPATAPLYLIKPGVVLLILFLFVSTSLTAATITVSSIPALQTAINNADPGDIIVMTNGVYTAGSAITVTSQGTASQPITITAQTVGGVEIGGTSGFQISSPAAYIIIKGFRFTHNTGTARISTGATHCLITRNVYECAPAGTGNKPYLSVSGDDNEISYNTFQHKDTEGCMITIQGPGGSGMAQRTWIHHNYFNDFAPSGANNSSAIQPGLSSRSLTPAHTLIEYNLFVDCRGENEGIVANKSSDNIYRYNTFGPGCREVSLRHGDRMEVYGNFFISSTGLRFSGDEHRIYSNYFEDCDFAINCVNGDGDVHNGDPLTSHDRPDNVQIVFNTLVNNQTNYRMPNRTNGLGATNITFANNIMQGGNAVSISGTYSNPVWAGNILWNVSGGDMPSGGYTTADPQLSEDGNSVYHIGAGSPAVNASAGSYPYVTIDIDGQSRGSNRDVGGDEYSTSPVTNRPLTIADVGPGAGSSGPGCVPVSASADDGNVPANVLDGNLNTRWSANGDGQWILFCLGEDPVTVSSVDVAFYNGDQRQAYFDIQLSDNGTSFTTVAANQQSSGSTLQPENFSITPQQARYVRLLGHGNSVNTWNSYTEVEVNTQTSTTCTEPVTASSDDGNVPPNVLDNDLNTRWSASGDGEWIRFCLDNEVSVSGVQIAFYRGDERQAIFDIQLSTSGTSWTTVASNVYSSGTSLALEAFTFPAQNAQYVRILGHGNTVNAWNSYTEVEISTGTSSSARLASGGESLPSEGSSSATVSYPNPGADRLTVQYEVKKTGLVMITLYNSADGRYTTLINENRKAGVHRHTFDVKHLSHGLHVIKIFRDGTTDIRKWIKQ